MFHICASRDCRTMYLSFEDSEDWMTAVKSIIEAGGSVLTVKADGERNPFIIHQE